MVDFDIKKVRMIDSSPVSLDWMFHKEDIEHLSPECIADRTFVDMHIVSVILGIKVDEIGYLVDETDPDCDPDFPHPVVRRGANVWCTLKSLIQYIEHVAELRWRSHYEMALQELRSLQRDPSGEA
ncbi:hypothetical protein PQR70_03335 [Paraburkholderia madseniana]|uniref:hypothetical protein n=1 Tax=Paraburkholderia madseniana TaxID=2599607 RepID=UPI0038BD2774